MFGAGCFWGVQATFDRAKGVVETAVGYSGGHTESPEYERVCTGTTAHAEVVKITFDPDQVSYEELLALFWATHNPTQVNRQGPDRGTQYRTAIFFYTPEQEKIATASKAALDASERFENTPVATEITPAGRFWPAEEYHQKYLEKRGLSHCH